MDDQAALGREGLSPPRLGAALAVAVLVVGAACSKDAAPENRPASACSVPPEIAAPKDVPEDFPWPDGVFVTQAESTEQFVSIGGFGETTVEELFEITRTELLDEGFDIINTDFEGFEAELYFAKGNSLAGIAALREGPCDGYVKVSVVYDPLETAKGREALRKTRELSGESPSPDN